MELGSLFPMDGIVPSPLSAAADWLRGCFRRRVQRRGRGGSGVLAAGSLPARRFGRAGGSAAKEAGASLSGGGSGAG